MKVLQTSPLPLGYRALDPKYNENRVPFQPVKHGHGSIHGHSRPATKSIWPSIFIPTLFYVQLVRQARLNGFHEAQNVVERGFQGLRLVHLFFLALKKLLKESLLFGKAHDANGVASGNVRELLSYFKCAVHTA